MNPREQLEKHLGASVSHETFSRLEEYSSLIKRWNRSINLISPATVSDIWERHICDSAQIFRLLPKNTQHLVDLGSGGGLPGIVLASILRDQSNTVTTLVESDTRKASFLRTAIRKLDLRANVCVERIERVAPQSGDVVTARALAPLPRLLPWALRHAASESILIFPKGASWREELSCLDLATRPAIHPSLTAPESAILEFSAAALKAEMPEHD